MASVQGLDPYIPDGQLFVDVERAKVAYSMLVQSVVDVPSLTCRLFQPLVSEPSSVVAVGVGDEDPGVTREPAGRGRVDDEGRVRGGDD